MKLDSEQVKVLRILRLMRFVLVLRKASAEKKRPHNHGQGLQFSSPVERVLEIFREITEVKGISQSVKDQVKWAADVISSNKLYSISVDTDKTKAEGTVFLEREVQSWVRLASEAGNDTGSHDNGLENFLTNRRGKQIRNGQQDEVDNIIKQEVEDLGQEAIDLLMATLDTMDDWHFDVFDLEAQVEGKVLSVMTLVLCKRHDLLAIHDIPITGLNEFINAIERGYVKRNPFHNAIHAADCTQAFHYLITQTIGQIERNEERKQAAEQLAREKANENGAATKVSEKVNSAASNFLSSLNNNKDILGTLEIFAGILACAIHDFEHPGFNNQFLIRTRHKMALRYNDMSVLENHHLAASFAVMFACSVDPLQNLAEDQYRSLRRMIIKMVLATDISQHFGELSLFRTKLTSKDFPTNSSEDKQSLLNILVHAADISNPGNF